MANVIVKSICSLLLIHVSTMFLLVSADSYSKSLFSHYYLYHQQLTSHWVPYPLYGYSRFVGSMALKMKQHIYVTVIDHSNRDWNARGISILNAITITVSWYWSVQLLSAVKALCCDDSVLISTRQELCILTLSGFLHLIRGYISPLSLSVMLARC